MILLKDKFDYILPWFCPLFGQDIIRAFSSSCPHEGCRTSWKYSNENFTCTCHNAVFTNLGEKVSGPANSDLESFSVSRDENVITVST